MFSQSLSLNQMISSEDQITNKNADSLLSCEPNDAYFYTLRRFASEASGFPEISKLVQDPKELGVPMAPLHPKMSPPFTLGALALTCLYVLGETDPLSLSRFVMGKTGFLLKLLTGPKEDGRDIAMVLLLQEAERQNLPFKQKMIEKRCFEVLLPLFMNHNPHIRLLSSSISAGVYRNCGEGQDYFMNLGGEWTLVQLIKRDGDYDSILGLLMDNLVDLIYVGFIQVNDDIRVENLSKVNKANLIDILLSLNITSVRLR